MPANRIARQLLGVTLAGAVTGVGVGLAASGRSTAEAAGPGLPGAEVVGAESTVVAIRGTLSAEAVALIAPGVTDSGFIAVLRGEDCFTCEDLARQLRELQHATRRPLIVVTRPADSTVVAKWLLRERIMRTPVVALDVDRLLGTGMPVGTPAVLVVARNGTVLRGVAHPKRAKNVRLRSFAAELGAQEYP